MLKLPPKSVIHINFLAGSILFDARPIWSALSGAVARGQVHTSVAQDLRQRFGEPALHLAMRHYVMERAIEELKSALGEIYKEVPDPGKIPVLDGYRTVEGDACARARDRVLLAIDSFLFEFRAYLELLARFTHGFLSAIGKGPARHEKLSSGKTVQITGPRGNIRPHDFLLYACDKFGVATDWYDFLSAYRNFFTHEAAPYCALEDLGVHPPQFDLIIMKANIHDFQHADPSDYFRISECQAVVDGIRALSVATHRYLVEALGR